MLMVEPLSSKAYSGRAAEFKLCQTVKLGKVNSLVSALTSTN